MTSFLASFAASTKRTFANVGARTRATATAQRTTTSPSTTSTASSSSSGGKKTSLLSAYSSRSSTDEYDARCQFEHALVAALATEAARAAETEIVSRCASELTRDESSDGASTVNSTNTGSSAWTSDDDDFFASLLEDDPFACSPIFLPSPTSSICTFEAVPAPAFLASMIDAECGLEDDEDSFEAELAQCVREVGLDFKCAGATLDQLLAPLRHTQLEVAGSGGYSKCAACSAQEGTQTHEWEKALYMLPPADCTCFSTARD